MDEKKVCFTEPYTGIKETRRYHFAKPICDHFLWCRGKGFFLGEVTTTNPAFTAITGIDGVASIHSDDSGYAITITKGYVFDWDPIHEKIVAILDDYNNGKL